MKDQTTIENLNLNPSFIIIAVMRLAAIQFLTERCHTLFINICAFATLASAAVSLALPLHAQTPNSQASKPSSLIQTLHYQWTQGQTLRYLIQRDPYFAEPQTAFETVNPDAPYRVPIVERLTEKVLSVRADGTATLSVTLISEPGFENADAPQPPVTRTVLVTASGQVLSVSGPALGKSPAERDLLRGFAVLPPATAIRPDGLDVVTRTHPLPVVESKSAGHDGVLVHTTSAAQSDHLVFDTRTGRMEREISTMTITMSLVMTGRGRRGSDDFGHVVPNMRIAQTLTVERQTD